MQRPAATYRSPFPDADSDTSEAPVPRVDRPVTRSSTAVPSKPAAEAESASTPTQTTTVKRKRAVVEHDIMGDNWEETSAPRKKTSKRAKKPRLHDPEKVGNEELPRVETETQPTPKKTPDSEATLSAIRERHDKEILMKNKEIIALRARLDHDLVTKVEKPESQITIERLTAERKATKKAHEEEKAQLAEGHKKDMADLKAKYASDHKMEVADLKAKHASDMKRREDALEEHFREEIQRRKAEEKRKVEQEAAKLQLDLDAQEKAKVIKRNELLAVVLKRTTDIKMLYNRQRDGTIAQAKDSEVFSVQECADGLTALWAEQGALITSILPHELFHNHDFALEFEAQIIVRAQAWMQSLELRSAPQELLQTGWSLSALRRLMGGLFPYCETDMTTLYTAVVDVHRILQEATAVTQGGYAPTMLPIPSQNMVTMASSLASPLPGPSHIQQFFPPQQYQTSAETQDMLSRQSYIPTVTVTQPSPIMPFASMDFQQAFNPGASVSNPEVHIGGQDMTASMGDVEPSFHGISAGQYVPQNNPFLSANAAPPAQTAQPARPSYQRMACRLLRDRDQCFHGEACRFSHDPEVIAAARAEANGGEAMQDVDSRQPGPPAAATDDWRAAILCKWVTQFGTCRTADCGFMHPAGTHQSSNPIASRGAQQCKTEERHGRCKNRTCNFIHQAPHGPLAPSGGDIAMAEDTMSNAGFQTPGASNQQCHMEQRTGYCNRRVCKYTHQNAHGPQDSGPAQSINPFAGPSSLASRITFDTNEQRSQSVRSMPTGPRARGGGFAAGTTYDNNNQFGVNPPSGPRAQGGSLESRMTFTNANNNGNNNGNRDARPEQQLYNPRMNAAADSFTPGGRGGQQRGGRSGRGRGNFSGHNVFQNGQGQGPQNSINPFQGGGRDSNSSQGGGRGRGGSRGGRGGPGGGGRGRGGGGGAGFGGPVPQGAGGGMFGTGFGMG